MMTLTSVSVGLSFKPCVIDAGFTKLVLFVEILVQDRPFHLQFLVVLQAMNPAVSLTLLNSL